MLTLRTMTATDVPLGMRLKSQAGWNQTEADWRCFLDLEPSGCFVAELDGVAVGTTTTCVFGAVAWVAMVLVDAAVRGQGVGSALMTHALAYLDGRGVRSVRLDATPLGRPVYEKLGFTTQLELNRFAGRPTSVEAPGRTIAAHPDDYPELIAYAAAVTGAERGRWLNALFAAAPRDVHLLREAGHLRGFSAARLGTNALLVGPLLAEPDAGGVLLADALARYAGKSLFVDVPVANREAVSLVTAAGLTAQRPLYRMCRGGAVVEDQARLWSSSGPEMG